MSERKWLVRKARFEDAAGIIQVGRASFSAQFAHQFKPAALQAYLEEAYALAVIQASLENDAEQYWVGVDSDGIQGFLKWRFHAEHPLVSERPCHQLHRIYVSPAFQSTGLGQALMDESLRQLSEMKPYDVEWYFWLLVHSDNKRAQAFYRKNDFQARATGIEYYSFEFDLYVKSLPARLK